MGKCEYCKGENYKQSKLCYKCLISFINQWINTLKPSLADDLDCTNLFPEVFLWDMSDFVIKDINELLRCVEFELWTAVVVMSARILESQLKIHIKNYVGKKPPNTIGECIEVLRQVYSDDFLEHLSKMRELRNEAMHGERRFSSDESLIICKNVLGVVAWIHNF